MPLRSRFARPDAEYSARDSHGTKATDSPMALSRANRFQTCIIGRSPRPRLTAIVFSMSACGDDEALRQEVESLLRFESAADGFLERPAVAALADGPGSRRHAGLHRASMVGRTLGSVHNYSVHRGWRHGRGVRARDSKLGRDVAIKGPAAAFRLGSRSAISLRSRGARAGHAE